MIRKKTNDPLEDLKNYQPTRETHKSYNTTTLVAVFLVAVAITGTAFYVYNSYQDKPEGEVIVISADDNEIKVKPADPGGMVVDNMDKVVYDTINGTVTEEYEKNTKLLPVAEEPIDRKELEANQEPAPPQIVVEQVIINNAPEIIVNETVEVIEEAPIETEAKPEYIAPVKKEVSSKVTKATPKQEKFYKVQVASFRSKLDAEKEWANLSKRFPKLIGKYNNYIIAKNIEGKGVFHRLQIGPFNSENEASSTCKSLKESGVNCFIVKP